MAQLSFRIKDVGDLFIYLFVYIFIYIYIYIYMYIIYLQYRHVESTVQTSKNDRKCSKLS